MNNSDCRCHASKNVFNLCLKMHFYRRFLSDIRSFRSFSLNRMLRARLHSKAFPLAVLKNRSYIQAYSLATKSLKWDSGLRHLSTRIRNQSAPEAYSANYTMSKAAIVKYNGGNRCIECRGVFTENPLSKRSRKSCICIGCKRCVTYTVIISTKY